MSSSVCGMRTNGLSPRVWRRILAGALPLFSILSACGDPPQRAARPTASATPGPQGAGADEKPAPLVLTPVTPAPPAPAPDVRRKPQRPKTSPPAPAAPPPPATAVTLSPATPGTFLFTESGFTRIRGCLTTDQPPPSPSRLVVGPANGNRQHLERDQRDALGSGSLTAADLEYRPDGIFLTNLRQTQTSLLASQPTEFQPNPPVLLLPAAATAGQTWSFALTSRDGQVKIESQNRVESLFEPVTLTNGQVVQARKVLADSRISGQSSQGTLELSRRMTTWYAPQTGLPVREITDIKGRVGLCEVDSHIESTQRSI